jgi:serine/threonine protein kinase
MTSYYGDIDKKYTLSKKIGSGGTSKVYLAHSINNQKEMFAVKILKQTTSNNSKVFNNEINVLKQIKDANVVQLMDGGEGILTKESGKKYHIQYIVLELIKYGELFDYIFFPQKGFGEDIGKYIFTQLWSGLKAIHKAGISHRDMKTENIMLGADWQTKIADFGFSTKTEGKKGNGILYTALGTASYASPELLQKKPYLGEKSDIFSLGVSLFVLVTGKMPFKHALVDDPYYKEIVKGNFDNYWAKLESKVPSTTKDFKQLFFKLIAYDPKSRPSLEECSNDPWMKSFNPDLSKISAEFVSRTKIVQHKKELERRQEEQEENERKTQKNNFQVYKEGETVFEEEGLEKTDNDLEIEDADEEDHNPYSIRFTKEENPGDLFDYLRKNMTQKSKVIECKKLENEYKLAFGIQEDSNPEVDIMVGGEVLKETVEGLMEIKRLNEGHVVEFSRVLGNKYDFYNLFTEINNTLA